MRPLIIIAGLALATLTNSCTTPASGPGVTSPQNLALENLHPVRRIVTTEGADGQSFVLADGSSGNVVMLNGSRIERLWETHGMPVSIPVTSDMGANAGNAYREGFSGSSLYIADIPSGSGLNEVPLHKQESLDYIVLLEGEISLILDGGKHVPMKRGDILIQAGNNHSWINSGPGPARLLCVTLTGKRVAPGVSG